MNNVIYEGKNVKVKQVGENEYEVYTFSARNEDGIVSTDWNFSIKYTNTYSRDWLGRTFSNHYNVNKEKDYAYKSAMEYAKSYENR